MSDPIIPLQQWPEGIAQARVPANINALRVEALARPCLGVENNVIDPADGDVYIVGDMPSGAFATFSENDIAFARVIGNVSWSAWAPSDGLRLTMSDGSRKVYVGGSTNEWHDEGTGAVDSVNGQTGAVSLDAEDIPYDGTSSGLSATDVQGAIDELEGMVGGGGMANPMTTAGDIIIGGASGSPARLAAGTNGYVLTIASGAPTWAAASGGGGGLTNFTEGVNATGTNSGLPVTYLQAANAATSVDFACIPKASGGFLLSIPDGTAAGGNKRGANAVDLQLGRSAANQVPLGVSAFVAGFGNRTSANYAISVGYLNVSSGTAAFSTGASNTSSGNYSATFGQSNTASQQHAFAFGSSNSVSGAGSGAFGYSNTAGGSGAYALGEDCSASGAYSIAHGYRADARGLHGVTSRAGGQFTARGDAQSMAGVLRLATTDATPAVLSTDGAAPSATNQYALPNNSCYVFKAIVAVRENATGDSASWEVTFHIKRGANAASTALVGTPSVTPIGADSGAATWALAVTANTTRGAPDFTVTGEAAHTLRWVTDVYSCVQVVG